MWQTRSCIIAELEQTRGLAMRAEEVSSHLFAVPLEERA